MPHQGFLASQASHVQALKSRHAALSRSIEQEQQHASAPDHYIKSLKQQRLQLKDEIEQLKEASG